MARLGAEMKITIDPDAAECLLDFAEAVELLAEALGAEQEELSVGICVGCGPAGEAQHKMTRQAIARCALRRRIRQKE